jgi:hypothetical protein
VIFDLASWRSKFEPAICDLSVDQNLPLSFIADDGGACELPSNGLKKCN